MKNEQIMKNKAAKAWAKGLLTWDEMDRIYDILEEKTVPVYIDLYMMTRAGILKKSHTSYFRGYVSRKTDGYIEPYKGRFGTGFTHKEPNKNSSVYSFVTYYLYKD